MSQFCTETARVNTEIMEFIFDRLLIFEEMVTGLAAVTVCLAHSSKSDFAAYTCGILSTLPARAGAPPNESIALDSEKVAKEE